MTLLDRRQDGDDAEHTARHIDHRGPGAQRPSGWPGHVGKAAHHLGDLVERGTVLIRTAEKALFGAIDQARIIHRERVVAEPQTIHRTVAEVLHHDIRPGAQPLRDVQTLWRLKIETKTFLVAVVHGEVARTRTRQVPRRVPSDRLDTDHLGAKFDQDSPDCGTHDHVGELDDA